MKKRYPVKKYQIWLGSYHLGQGFMYNKVPELVATIKAPNFKVACLLYELNKQLDFINKQIKEDEYVDMQSCRWFYNFDTNHNSWTGKYYETKAEAQKSFEQ